VRQTIPRDNQPHQWPTREEWAKSRRSLFHDGRFDRLDFCRDLSAYASPNEIEALIAALRALWKREGARLRALQVPAELCRQQGESALTYYLRRKQMLPSEQELLQTADWCREARMYIQKGIKYVLDGSLLKGLDLDLERAIKDSAVTAILGPIRARYDAAYQAAIKKREAEIRVTPIDDAAWAEELQRRAGLDAMFGRS
jgi:hypothetical protein